MWSPPNLSRNAPASTMASIASPTTPAAGTTQESVRSRSAWAGSRVAMSTERSGLVSVGVGFMAPRAARGPAGGHAAPRARGGPPPPPAAGAVGPPEVARLVGVEALVVGLRAGPAGEVEPVAQP